MNDVKLTNISKIYGDGDAQVVALKNINLLIRQGEMIAIVGPSGSGKSTLLNIIGCLDKPTDGDYYLNEKSITSFNAKKISEIRNKTFGFVVQYFALLDDFTIYENIQIPLEYSKIKRKRRKEIIYDMLKKLKIEDKAKCEPKHLSGGQNQRVAIARALVNDPDIILADEPTGALDKKTGQEVIQIFKNLNKEGKTIIIITHDDNIANQCNRIIRLEDGQIINDQKLNYEQVIEV